MSSDENLQGLAEGLVRIHHVISRGVEVARQRSHGFAGGEPIDHALAAGFADYLRALTSVLHGHHAGEEDVHVQTPPSSVIEGKFTKLDPGSRAARYFAGFGAGKSTVAVQGIVKDRSGKTLAEFSQRRFGAMGVGGVDSLEKLTSDSKSIGKDIAEFLSDWARGKSLNILVAAR